MRLRPLEIGVCSWSLQVKSIPELEALLGGLGVSAAQLALGDPNHATWDEGDGLIRAAGAASFDITATMIGFPGEDYTSPATIKRTGGFGDPSRRQEYLKIFRWAVDQTVDLGVKILTTHVGFIPDPGDSGRDAFLDCLGEAADYAAEKAITVAMETGQETADLLRRSIDEMAAPNLKVNFDPANMILYDKGDPIEALDILGSDLAHVHVKDALYPDQEGAWGQEVPLGAGAVGMKRYVERLAHVEYTGPIVIEREVGSQADRIRDITEGVTLLKGILSEL